MSNVLAVSVDIGRSSVKASATWGKDTLSLEVPTVVSTSLGTLAQSNTVNSISDQDIAKVVVNSTQGDWMDGLPNLFLFGKHALKQGASPSAFSEGLIFHRFSVAAILWAVAWFQNHFKAEGDAPVHLAINLTYLNNEAAALYSSALKGRHEVALGSPVSGRIEDIPITINIVKLFCFQQGYAGLFCFLKDGRFKTLQKQKGLCVDIGRRTVDFSIVEELTLSRGSSAVLGTSILIDGIRQAVSKSHGLTLTEQEVERSFLDTSYETQGLTAKGGVKPWDVATQAVDGGESMYADLYAKIKVAIMNFAGTDSLEYIFLCGGGALLYRELFAKDFKVPILLSEFPLRSNTQGMLQFISMGL